MATLLPTKSYQDPSKVTGGMGAAMTSRMPTGIPASAPVAPTPAPGAAPSLRPAPAVQMEAMKSTNPAAAIMPTRDPNAPNQTSAPNTSPYGGRLAAFRGLFPGGGQSPAHAAPPAFNGLFPGSGGNRTNPAAAQFRQDRR